MELKLYDTLTREKRVFTPIDAARVRMYVCGPTVYDFAHIGNARPVIVFDVLFRLLRHLYGADHVTYVRNITDVDDKINARAVRDYPGVDLNEAIRKVTDATEAQFQADVKALGCLPPTHQPRATDFVLPRNDGRTDMKSLIQELLDRRHAYVVEGTEGKEVLFDVASMPDYGALSGRKLEDQKAGARIAVDAHKKNPGDFVLWKESGAKEPGWNGKFEFVPDPNSGYDAEFIVSPENASRLGLNSRLVTIHGRPGWHIECSAMSAAYLGKVFDIHGGGLDLIFPHHENEIAQSRCAFHTDVMANYWMHNGFLQVEGEKMSKSLGNFLTIRDLRRNWHGRCWPGNAIRLAMLGTHYRQPINWSYEKLAESEKELFSLAEEFFSLFANVFKNEARPFSDWLQQADSDPFEPFLDNLFDDLNVAGALATVRSLYRRVGTYSTAAGAVLASLELLGILDRETIFLNSSPVFRGFLDPEVAKGAFLVGRKLQIGLLNKDRLIIDEVQSLLSEWNVTTQAGPGGMLFLIREAKSAQAGRKKIEELIEARTEARKRRDFKESDRIRDELAAMGVVLKDSKDGTTWEIAR